MANQKTYNASSLLTMGMLMGKIEYWQLKYQFSFQFWPDGENNVYIYKEGVELRSMGGRGCIEDILRDTIQWCEKANPRFAYPQGLEITNAV